MTLTSPAEAFESPCSPVISAFDDLRRAWCGVLSAVEAGGLDQFDDGELLEFLQAHEQLRNQTALLDHHLVAEVVERDLADRYCQPNPARLLASRLLISNAEARRRVAAAAAVGPRRSALGVALEPERPVLAAAQASGMVGPENTAIAVRALNSVSGRGLDQQAIDDGEALLADFATTFGPDDLKLFARRVVDGIDPDGKLPADQAQDRRSFELSRASEHAWRCSGLLTGETGAQLQAFLHAHSQPRPATPEVDGKPGVPDERTRTQRMHDALGDLAARGLREGGGSTVTAGAPTIIVTINADDLIEPDDDNPDTDGPDTNNPEDDDLEDDGHPETDGQPETSHQPNSGAADDIAAALGRTTRRRRWRLGRGHGVTTDGTILSAAEIAALASEAEIIPVWLSATGEVLDLGRTKRCASRIQTLALIARDVGCSFPGCDRPPEWCERHHIISWLLGGETDIDNLTLLCRYHHHNFEMRGWTCRLNSDGLPEWIPPKWINRVQEPMINSRISMKTVR